MSETVIIDRHDGLMVVTINRPEVRNAVNRDVAERVAAAMDELDGDSSLRVAVLTGANGVFSSGMDLKAFVSGELPVVEGRGLAGFTESPPAKPLIAAVEGYALAGGFEIAISCDLVVAARDAVFGIPEVKRGLVAAGGGLLRLPKQVPQRIAMQMALTGEPVDASRAFELGLINQVSAPGEALAGARALAARIIENGPLAVALSKQVVNQAIAWPVDEMFARQQAIIAPIFESEDAREGALAFTEKRKPVWSGR